MVRMFHKQNEEEDDNPLLARCILIARTSTQILVTVMHHKNMKICLSYIIFWGNYSLSSMDRLDYIELYMYNLHKLVLRKRIEVPSVFPAMPFIF